MAGAKIKTQETDDRGNWPVDRAESFSHFSVDTAAATAAGRGDVMEVSMFVLSNRYHHQEFNRVEVPGGKHRLESGAFGRNRVLREQACIRMSKGVALEVASILLKQTLLMGSTSEEISDFLKTNGVIE